MFRHGFAFFLSLVALALSCFSLGLSVSKYVSKADCAPAAVEAR